MTRNTLLPGLFILATLSCFSIYKYYNNNLFFLIQIRTIQPVFRKKVLV